ncbi:transcriptional regulator [Roseisolibacter agri]|uniref:Transcriptional regulator n=2 Tax=Roseisolibacter agri TaxID=2014610 RepID=A0AA37QJ36_9BACT|nr:transcriptional regulator [Roseisolibacter agri]
MATTPTDGVVYACGAYELDTRLHELRRGSEPQHVEPQVFDVLAHLFARRDRVVPKEELLDAVWGHRYVAPTTLNSRIKAARQALGDDGTAQRVIRTVHGLGFRVVADVVERTAAATGGPATLEQHIRFATATDGVRIAHATSGTGPPLVKPANWLTHLEHDWESPVWQHWLRELSRDHTLVRYDERGCGLSDRDVADLSFDAWVHDLETVVDALGLERFPLLALSQGCAVAIAYAARHPERVSRLVLYGGYVQGALTRARTAEEREEAELVMRQMPLGWGRDNPAFRLFFAARFLPEGTPEQLRWFSDLQRITTTPEIAVRLRSTASTIDVSELAPLVRAPTLVLHATGDAVIPFDQGRLLAALVPGARFISLESRNHVLLETEPAWARFTDEVRRFLAADDDRAAVTSRSPRPPRRSAPPTRSRSG